MDNSAFTPEPCDRPDGADGPPSTTEVALEMRPCHATEESQPLCQCDKHCVCGEPAARPADAPQVRLKQWNRAKTAALVAGVAALLVWCGVMVAMGHYGVL
ncbi:uncharacterized protein LOC119111853 isoform X2 [Pollicipes pollicipes]|nr:uncharacterized protein LOC119111853 isoform X2 [Pollicipes pollicipes]XP_037091599.1 uncharacterized protein LOC119111853 isoform X2 [Pollicipes pollicipes]XP_037091609.1 uncharacterized protein LOC119111853 isoform X2 [Pollicipes pollicipes]XP_037091618.1 uncharacterized protein LOC119111853 isoform X2 [Pollicipes pollicipes]XP_037091628.1 uncharacterized protein LOC119111853 isoform X2 [Pollicipes pollicipes]XP_037091635.1 uncharacterized protein LOC119111853 isoform X2 [Pollicipes polli